MSLLYSSIPTIASELINDVDGVIKGEITQKTFLKRYAHLRPGTYDILSLRYDQRKSFIKGSDRKRANHLRKKESYTLSDAKKEEIEAIMKGEKFTAGINDLLLYVNKSIQGREYSKFVFTKVLSDVLEIIAGWAENVGLSREEVSFLSITDILDTETLTSGRTLEHELRCRAQRSARQYETTKVLHLPHLIIHPNDVKVLPLMRCRPNFITRKRCQALFVFLDGRNDKPPELTDKIVVIESADPGFDWIFAQNIAGLITKFGGANSHMSIRCAELELPAAIGCGEQIFDRLLKAKAIDLDCSKGHVAPVWG